MMASGSGATSEVVEDAPKLTPGMEGIWVFVGGDMLLFLLLFGCFMAERTKQPGLFEQGRQSLNYHFGGVNTLILLASSLFVVLALQAARCGKSRTTGRWLAAAIVCGLAFGGSKVLEYTGKIASGFTLLSNDFFTFYYVLTGLHLLHVIAGCIGLAVFCARGWGGSYLAGSQTAGLEGIGLYWHMVDLLWILLFPLLYLMR